MKELKLDNEVLKSEALPPFSVTVKESHAAAIYSDTEIQIELVNAIRKNGAFPLFDQQDGLYERLTVQENIVFYHKWFGCQIPLPEILVMFELQNCAKTTLKKCTVPEIRRVYFAKYFMAGEAPVIFQEPIHGADVLTINTFIQMIQKIIEKKIPVLILVSNMEHALLVGDVAYRLHESGLHEIEIDPDEEASGDQTTLAPLTDHMFKLPVKVEDKVILFDPPEIDYIESQDGKSMIVVNHESFPTDATLTELEKKLEIYGFYRCHRSYIVNLQKVREIITWSKNTYSLRIDNKKQATIPLSRTKLQDIQEIFNLK